MKTLRIFLYKSPGFNYIKKEIRDGNYIIKYYTNKKNVRIFKNRIDKRTVKYTIDNYSFTI